MKHLKALSVVGLVLLLSPLVFGQSSEKLPPTEVLHLMFREMALNPDAQRTTLTVPLAKRVQTEGLSEAERFALGEVYFTNLQPVEAKAAFEVFMDGTDARASMAWERVMQILARAEGKIEEVERMLPEYRNRFSPSPENVYGIASQVGNVANAYKEKGDHAKVVALIEEELADLSYDAPYRSLLLPGIFFESYAAVGKADEARERLARAVERLEARLDGKATAPVDFPNVEHVRGVFHRIEDHFIGTLLETNDPGALNALRAQKLVEQIERRMPSEGEGGPR